ncbi:MAG: 3'-5' exonuclease [Lautropia sp.]|nr:3'-5' exonuclease [Lautropia sp.]
MNWWRRLAGSLSRAPRADSERWVVVDVEASGLDAHRDRLLAIAGVAVRFSHGQPRIELADSFEVTLRQDDTAAAGEAAGAFSALGAVDRANILLHGTGVGAQLAGVPPAQGLEAFRQWVGESPVVAYHAAFDRILIQRHCQAHLGRRLDNRWLDLEHVVALLVPALPDRTLDTAMSHLGIACPKRHEAAADTLATADILLRLWPMAKAQMGGVNDFRAMARLAAGHRWLRRQGGRF